MIIKQKEVYIVMEEGQTFGPFSSLKEAQDKQNELNNFIKNLNEAKKILQDAEAYLVETPIEKQPTKTKKKRGKKEAYETR